MPDEKTGYHKGALEALVKEKQELTRILNIVNSLIERHAGELQDAGIDVEAFLEDLMDEQQQKAETAQQQHQQSQQQQGRSQQQSRNRSQGRQQGQPQGGSRQQQSQGRHNQQPQSNQQGGGDDVEFDDVLEEDDDWKP